MISSRELVTLARDRTTNPAAVRGRVLQYERRKGAKAPGTRQMTLLHELAATPSSTAVPASALAAVAEAIQAEHPDLTSSEALSRAHDLLDALLNTTEVKR